MASLPGCGLAVSDSYICQHEHATLAEKSVQDVLRTLRESPESWTYVKEKEGVNISKKEVPGQTMPLVRGDARVDKPALGLLKLLTSDSAEIQLTLDPQMKNFEAVETVDEQTRFLFTEFKGLWPVAERYFSVIQSVRQVEEGVLMAVTSMDHPSIEKTGSKGAVKGIVNYTGWLFKPVGTDSCDISYMANIDLNGKIPGFVLNMVVNENPECVCRLIELASKFELTLGTVAATTEDLCEVTTNVEPLMNCNTEERKRAVSFGSAPSTAPSKQSSRSSSWKEYSGRDAGKEKYKFGDLTRGWLLKKKLKRQTTMGPDVHSTAERKQALLGDLPVVKMTEPSLASTAATSSSSGDESVPETLDSLFSKAVKAATQKSSNDDLLQLYAHFKQATVGPNEGKRPSAFNVKDCYKYDAWKGLGNMSSDAAKQAYCGLADRLKPGWREAGNQTSKVRDVKAEVVKAVSVVPQLAPRVLVKHGKPDTDLQNRVVVITIASAFGLKLVAKLSRRSKAFLVILLLMVLNSLTRSRFTSKRTLPIKTKGPVDWQGLSY